MEEDMQKPPDRQPNGCSNVQRKRAAQKAATTSLAYGSQYPPWVAEVRVQLQVGI